MNKMKLLGVLMLGVLVVALGFMAPGLVQAVGNPQATPPADTASAKAWLGVAVQPLNPRLVERLGVGDIKGVAIVRVSPNSPAVRAGLRAGDVITAYNLVAITVVNDLVKQVDSSKPGDKVTLTIRRGKDELKVEVTLEAKKAPAPQAFGKRLPPELSGVAPKDLFQHFQGVKADFTDKDGKPVSIQVTPGIVSLADAASITLKPNGKEGTVTYKIDSSTVILLQARRVEASELKKDDRVLVQAVNENARSVRIVGDSQHMFPLGGLLPGGGIGGPRPPATRSGLHQRLPFMGPAPDRGHKGSGGRVSPGASIGGPTSPEIRRGPTQAVPFREPLPGRGQRDFEDDDTGPQGDGL